jgi:hypothetical protein
MPSRKADEIAKVFARKVASLDLTRSRIETAYSKRVLRLKDVESSYNGLFLQAVLAYESAMEDLVLGLIVKPDGVRSLHANVRPRIEVRSYAHALELASGAGRAYADWIGKDQLIAKANMFLRGGEPFSSLLSIDWNYVNRARYMRNAIAHPSQAALDAFRGKVIGSTPLPARERTVQGYLRGFSGVTGQTRWELHVAGLRAFVTLVAH